MMRQRIRSWQRRRGAALLIVLMLGLLAFVAVTGLLGAVATHSRMVGGEAVSDRSIVLANEFIDRLLDQINAMQELPMSGLLTNESTNQVLAELLSRLNGGNANTDTLVQIRARVATWAYDTGTATSYRVDGAAFSKGVLKAGTLEPLDGVGAAEAIALVDPLFASDNRWFQIETNCDYWWSADKPDMWRLRATAFNISAPEMRRTIQVEAGPSQMDVGASPNWYRRTTGPGPAVSFCEYAGFYNASVAFGPYELLTGSERSNAALSVSGWAQAPLFSHATVGESSSGVGRFSLKKWKLATAAGYGYVYNGYPADGWSTGARALFGADPARSPADVGMQDQCLAAYYVNGDATIVFSVTGGAGEVTINGVTLDMPSNGVIYVEGNAWVGGTVHGRCTVGCSGTINIQDNIVYSIAPRTVRGEPMCGVPDALGLVAGEQIFIPRTTYDTHRTLRVDAALFSCQGGLQIDSTAGTHNATVNPHYQAFWNGSQALWDTSVPLMRVNGEVRGYEVQHANYDWNLTDYGAPPMFPVTEALAIAGQARFVLLQQTDDAAILRELAGATPTALAEGAADYDPQCATSYAVVGGIRYYTAGSSVTRYARCSPEPSALFRYRASWREQIGTPVCP